MTRHVARCGGCVVVLLALMTACGGATPPPADQSGPPLEGDATPSDTGAQAAASSKDVRRGVDALQAGDAEGAKAILEKARDADPKDPQAAFYLAATYETLGDAPKGIELYREALKLDPKLTEAYVNLSYALLNSGQAAEAAEVAGRGLSVSPDTPDLLTNRALALEAAGQAEQALEAYGKAVQASKDNAQLRYTYAELLAKQQQPDNAKEQLKLLEGAEDPKVLAAAGNLLGQLKEFEPCVAFFTKAIAKNPAPSFYIRRGVCHHGKKDDAAANADYEKALAADPNSVEAHYYLGFDLAKKDRKKACEHLLAAAAKEGDVAKAARDRAKKLRCK